VEAKITFENINSSLYIYKNETHSRARFISNSAYDRKGERQGLWVYYRDDAHKYIESKGYFRHGIAVKKWKYFSEFGTYKKRKIQPRPYLHLYKNILP